MSVFGFDIRDYTDPDRILEESLAPRPPVTVDNMTGLQVSQDVGQYMPTQFDTQPTANNLKAVDAMMGTSTPGINPAATEQPPAVPIPGTAALGIMGSEGTTTPAVIKPMEGVTNEDRVHAMAMVLGAVGQNNFSSVLNAAQTGLMEKEINAKKHNDALTKLTTADYSIQNGKVNYVPARYEIDSDGNYVLRSEGDRAKEVKDWMAANPSAGTEYEKLAVAQEITRLTGIVDDENAPSDVREKAEVTLQALQSQLPKDSTDDGRKAIITKSVERSEGKLADFATNINGVLSAKKSTEEALDMIREGRVDTGLLSGILTNLGLGDYEQGKLDAKAVYQLLQNLQITKLTPVSNYEIQTVSGLWARVMNGEEQNIGALEEALTKLNANIDKGFQAYGRDLNNMKTHNSDGYYDQMIRNYEGTLRDYGYDIRYGDDGDVFVGSSSQISEWEQEQELRKKISGGS